MLYLYNHTVKIQMPTEVTDTLENKLIKLPVYILLYINEVKVSLVIIILLHQ
jgi:hypothetical protein